MSLSEKYGRTYHYPFSPGTTSDDRISTGYWEDLSHITTVIHTEKLDGENNFLSQYGVFARSHAAPTTSPWTRALREKWSMLKRDLGDYEIFGENLYAIHSIRYPEIDQHYFVFGVRENGRWLCWEETAFIASFFDFPTVPVLGTSSLPRERTVYEQELLQLVQLAGTFGSVDVQTGEPCTMEGVVTRNVEAYEAADFRNNVWKYVRKGHVKTDEHWIRNWKRAPLNFEKHVAHT
ncbi:RNA ligase family protein [Hymenobacter sp. BT664]|uniref:RNA ligase family protein n=1 Tax=Hymenobacter montanus TaxID=2771359 RepID=A0A927BCD7_9BACT|nr:RNA ligase family protein [Hymenobacter montanus]MBD2767534.1 RNA ligase family protein [Hymenobacter montanus]